MKKKEQAEADAADAAGSGKKGKSKAAAPEKEKAAAKPRDVPETPDQLVGEEQDGGDLMYGAPDDVVWSDKSSAIRDAENAADEDPNKVRTIRIGYNRK